MQIIFILLFAFTESSTKEWIDPYDMNVDPKINVKTVEKSDSYNGDCYCPSNDISLPYLKRFVNLLINSATPDDVNSNQKVGKFVFNSENGDFQFLIDFTKKQYVDNDELRKLDSVISSLFQKDLSVHIFETLFSVKSFMNNSLSFRNFITIVGIILCLCIVFHLLKSQFSFWYITKYFFLIITVIDYGFRYQTLLEEAEIHNMKLEYSSMCDTTKMTWSEWSKFLISHQNCEKIIVTPIEVAMHQVKQIIIIPLSALGTGTGKFAQELWKQLPFPWNILIFPLMLLFFTIIYAITVMVMNNSPIKIKLFHLINFEFGHQVDIKNHVSEATLDKLLDVVKHRPMIEDEKQEVSNQKTVAEKSRKLSQKVVKRKSEAVGSKTLNSSSGEESHPGEVTVIKDDHPNKQSCHSKQDVIPEEPNVTTVIESTNNH